MNLVDDLPFDQVRKTNLLKVPHFINYDLVGSKQEIQNYSLQLKLFIHFEKITFLVIIN